MFSLVCVLVLLAVLIVLATSKAPKYARKSGPVSYIRRPLMTAREREFLVSLRAALPSNAEIYAQVAMGVLIGVQRGPKSERNRFDKKVIDFVVCSASGGVLYAIELDDRSHGGQSAQRRDTIKNEICSAAGLPLVRYQSVRTDASVLRKDFERFAGVENATGKGVETESVAA